MTLTRLQEATQNNYSAWQGLGEGDRWDPIVDSALDNMVGLANAVASIDVEVLRLQHGAAVRPDYRALELRRVVDEAETIQGLADSIGPDPLSLLDVVRRQGDFGQTMVATFGRLAQTLETQAARIGDLIEGVAKLNARMADLEDRPASHPVDVLQEVARKNGWALDADRVGELRRICDEPADPLGVVDEVLKAAVDKAGPSLVGFHSGGIVGEAKAQDPAEEKARELIRRGETSPNMERALDDLLRAARLSGVDLDPDAADRLRALVAPRTEATYPDGRPLDSGVNGPDGDAAFRSARSSPAFAGRGPGLSAADVERIVSRSVEEALNRYGRNPRLR